MSSDESPEFGDDDESIIKSAGTGGESRTEPGEIDWAALWEEFGFDTEDAIGAFVISQTQLVAAVESSDQQISGDPHAIIADAVEDGTLQTNHAVTNYGEKHLRGYILPEVAA